MTAPAQDGRPDERTEITVVDYRSLDHGLFRFFARSGMIVGGGV